MVTQLLPGKASMLFFVILIPLNRRHWADRLLREGIVTGGQYNSHQGCQPYTIPKCDHHEPGPYENCSGSQSTPSCKRECISGYSTGYRADKHYGKNSYSIGSDVAKIQTEIMTNGPVEGAFSVYADFPTYTSGKWLKTLIVRLDVILILYFRCLSAHNW